MEQKSISRQYSTLHLLDSVSFDWFLERIVWDDSDISYSEVFDTKKKSAKLE